jgi:hypothetical protein
MITGRARCSEFVTASLVMTSVIGAAFGSRGEILLGRVFMKQLICLLLLTFAVQPMFAKDNYPLTLKVVKMKNIENQNGSFHFAGFGGSARAGWTHDVSQHIIAEGSDGITYELVPENSKDMLTPGTFQAKIEQRDMKVCEPKDNGKCKDVKFNVVAAHPTAAQTDTPTEPAK